VTLDPADLADFLQRYGGDLLELRGQVSKRELAAMCGMIAIFGRRDLADIPVAERARISVRIGDAVLLALGEPRDQPPGAQ